MTYAVCVFTVLVKLLVVFFYPFKKISYDLSSGFGSRNERHEHLSVRNNDYFKAKKKKTTQ